MTGLVSAALFVLSLTSTLLLPHPGPAPGPVPAPSTSVRQARAPVVAPVAAPPDSHRSLTTGAVWPLSPRPEIVNGFAPPARRWDRGHRGVDLAGGRGQTVLAPLTGTVTFAGALAGRGVVVIDHGARRTTYEPVAAVARVGDTVRRGEPIGTLQGGLGHCAPEVCLHWGLLEGTEYLDPLSLVSRAPVRLLPLLADLFTPGGVRGGTRSSGVRW
jgi:murein DD-endopeptidase MepM/ murein hydrolase activator NlpD